MREIAFFKANIGKWEEMDRLLLAKNQAKPDHLYNLYIQLNDDLSYAETNFPDSQTLAYLNQLTSRVHQRIYRNKKEKSGRIKHFWLVEFPALIFKYRKEMLISFIVFTVSCLIGAFSTAKDIDFVRIILGDDYVDKTLDNIEKGTPLGIYDSMEPLTMFLQITFNNVRVSFTVFAAGIVFSLASGFMLFYNGVMLGCFQYFFYAKNLLYISALTIWVHGTLEITSIVIAGGAGIALGNSFMFPGTYSRLASFQKTAKESVKIIVGLIPIFIIAGFLEGFVTRYSQISTFPASVIIALSLAGVLFYFIYYPYSLTKVRKHDSIREH